MSEAHAMMHLREYVNDDDVDTAIRYPPVRKEHISDQSLQCLMRVV